MSPAAAKLLELLAAEIADELLHPSEIVAPAAKPKPPPPAQQPIRQVA